MTLRGGAHDQQGLRTSIYNLTGNEPNPEVFTINLIMQNKKDKIQ